MGKGSLLVLFGGSGSGKSTVLSILRNHYSDQFVEGRKLSTRPRRATDPVDMRVAQTRQVVEECDIKYERYGHLYGIHSAEIQRYLNEGVILGLVIQDCDALVLVQRLFPNSSAWYVSRPLSEQHFRQISKLRNTPDEEIERRILSMRNAFDEYVQLAHMFTGVIANEGNEAQLAELVSKQIVRHCSE